MNVFDSKDATLISGITDYTWLQLLSETDPDLTRWPSEKHFTSWLGLSPGQNNSGKKNRKAKKKGKPKAGQIFRVLAQGLINSKDVAIGAFGRRLGIAIKAMARKLSVLYWRVMVKGLDYAEKGVQIYEGQIMLSKLRTITKLANELNLEISGKQTVS